MNDLHSIPGFAKIIDLSHSISETMPHWPGDPVTKIQTVGTVARDGYYLNELTLGEHSGTHVGAPIHFGGRDSIDAVAPEKLIVRGVKIDVSQLAVADPDYLLSLDDLLQWEEQHGNIPVQCLVVVQTNWSQRWSSPREYLGAAEDGLHFPGVSIEAAAFLVQQRSIVGIGIDSAGIDGGQSESFQANILLATHGACHLENLANLENLGIKGFYIFIGALKIERGSGSPCRVLAFSPTE